MRYRRTRQEGGTYFFTVNLADRSSRLLVEQVDLLRDSVRKVKQRHPFGILGWVVLPDHMHAMWTLPQGDGDCATRWMLIKGGVPARSRQASAFAPAARAKVNAASGNGVSGSA
jgi:putative transposase